MKIILGKGRILEEGKNAWCTEIHKDASRAGEELTRKSEAREEDGREPNNVEVYKSLKDSSFYPK